MEHSTEQRQRMRERKRRERRRRLIMLGCIGGCAVMAAILGVALIILSGSIKREKKLAQEDYLAKNWQTVSVIPGGKQIEGCIDGEPYSYKDMGTYFGGISVNGISLEGMTYAQARTAMIEQVESALSSINMTINIENGSLVLTAGDFDVTTNVNDILRQAYHLGRESSNDYAANYLKQQELLSDNAEFSIEYDCNSAHIASRVAEIAAFVNTEPTEPYVTISQRPAANSNDGDTGETGEPVARTDGSVTETVYAANGTAIAYITYNPGKNGYTFDQEAMLQQILASFEEGDYDATLSAELSETEPVMTVQEMSGSVKPIASYTSTFESSVLNRRRNIQKAAGILNGCIVAAGQEVSFNEYVGPRTEAGGWLPAPGITGGNSYEDSPGGGICQVSGTLYNALLACGPNKIEITERHHHSWPSEYVPYGLDATVDTYGPDLVWKNVSESDLYIFTYADTTPEHRVMYVYIYGTPESDGTYYETYAETTDIIEPDETVVVENPLWPSGYSKEIIKSRKGYRARAYLKKFDAAGELIETIYLYTDTYAAVTGKIEVGTGDVNLPRPT